ncbi:MAG: glycosyltransferase family 9 protein [Pseudomonadota bacterium]|nr:glycosyltransferase family 9 protein [Pseudomonadota bacterium]
MPGWPPPPTDPPLPVPLGARGLESIAPRRVAIVQLGFLGDVLLATPVARALRARWPGARIVWVVHPRWAEALAGNGNIDEVVPAAGLLGLIRALRGADLCVDLQRSMATSLAAWLARVRLRVGRPAGRLRDSLLSHVVPAQRAYSAHFRASILRVFGVSEVSLDLSLAAASEVAAGAAGASRQVAPDLAASIGTGPIVALAPFARLATRQWPMARWEALGRRLRAERDARLLVLWGPGDEERAGVFAHAVGATLAEPTGIRGLAAQVAACDVLVGACSGPRHVAVSQRVPTVTVHGATAVGGWTRPTAWHRAAFTDLPCRPCNRPTCPIGVKCLVDLDEGRVLALVDAVLGLGPEPELTVRIRR